MSLLDALRSAGSRACEVLCIALAALCAATPLAAQGLSGDYVLSVDGSAILGITLLDDGAGRITGSVSAAGKKVPLSGVTRGTGAVFVSSAPDGSRLHWEVQPQGSGLAVAMAPPGIDGQPDPALAQRHLLVRGRAGSGGLGRTSQKWIARLSAAADSIVSWCASPLYATSDLCINAMQVLRKVAPALMVARFATSGQVGSLMRALGQPPASDPMAVAPTITSQDDSFFSAVEPPPDEMEDGSVPPDGYDPPASVQEPPPPTPVAPSGVAPTPALAQMLLGGGAAAPSAAASLEGEYVMLHAGSEVLRVRFAAARGDVVSGTLSLMGTPFPITGTVTNGTVSFSTRAAGGEVGNWQGRVDGDRLSLTLTSAAGSERYELMRQGSGWSDAVPLAREWDAALRGRTIAHSAGARDPATGAVVETLLHFCTDGTLRIEVGGSLGAARPAWRAVASNEQAAVELRAPEGTIQVGLQRQGAAMTFAGQPARIVGPSARCP